MIAAFLAAAALSLPGGECPTPPATPWRAQPDGCVVLKRGQTATLPRAAAEVDVWSANLQVHLRQRRSYPDQWGFSARGYAAGWVPLNRDLFNYGRPVIAYWWRG